jgi:carbon monoxide dehydrogenase subunit G
MTSAAIFSPEHSPTISARPPSRFHRSRSGISRPFLPSMRSERKEWETAARCSRPLPSRMLWRTRLGATIALPLTLQRVWALANNRRPDLERGRPTQQDQTERAGGTGMLTGGGEVILCAPVEEVWRRLLDVNELAAIVPGCRKLKQEAPDRYSAQVVIGVAGIRGSYDAQVELRDKRESNSLRLIANAQGALGFGAGSALVTLQPVADGRTRLVYAYEADVGGKVAAVGQRMLGSVTRYLIAQFFSALERRIAPPRETRLGGWLSKLRWHAREGRQP